MDDDQEPWESPEDEYGEGSDYRFPSSWGELKERWHGDAFVRVIVGAVIVAVVATLWMCSGLR